MERGIPHLYAIGSEIHSIYFQQTVGMEVVLFFLTCAFLSNTEASTRNVPSSFNCLNGRSTNISSLCDGYNHCDDYSDEKVCESYRCHPLAFQCDNGRCVTRRWVCNNLNNCGDSSDERHCNSSVACLPGWHRCSPRTSRCIPVHWVCDGYKDCPINYSDESNCEYNKVVTLPGPEVISAAYRAAHAELKTWFVRRRKPGSGIDRWGSQVHRIAVALHLADNSTFRAGNSTGDEIRYELTTQLLGHLGENKMTSQELALYIHGLLVACVDPKDFHGKDLVKELRRRVEAAGNFTNPFLVLVLCNAGDVMTARDVDRVTTVYDSQHRPFWTNFQAVASMALSCISSRGNIPVDERVLKEMLQELKKHQFRNGTVDNFRTTALVTQALFIHDSYKTDFDLNLALQVLTKDLNGSMSLLDAYYTLPILSRRSLLNVTSAHCKKETLVEEEALEKVLNARGETMAVLYSVWIGDQINVGRTWRLRMRVNSTIYDAIENVAKIDNRQKVVYNVVDGKPFVAALNGKEDDLEMGMFWFVYLKTLGSDRDPKVLEESPVDVKLQPNQEIILWYKRAPWSSQSMQKSIASA